MCLFFFRWTSVGMRVYLVTTPVEEVCVNFDTKLLLILTTWMTYLAVQLLGCVLTLCLSVLQGVVFVFAVLISLIAFFISCQCQRKGQLIFAASALTSIRNEQ